MQIYPKWQEFYNLPINDKLAKFTQDSTENGELFDILYAQQFKRDYLDDLFILSDKIRAKAKTKDGADYLRSLLSDKRAMLFFVQPSTRTFMSFLNACQILGMQISEIRDSSTSSEVKGESAEDMIRTLSSYVDIIITRHFDEGFAEKAAWLLNSYANRAIPIINGGSGKDQHPTQGLLDLYTINRAFNQRGGIDGKKITMIGDLKRGRTVRSLSRLLALYNNVEIIYVSPKEFSMKEDILEFLTKNNVKFTITEDMQSALKEADAFYLTRLQDEYDKEGEKSSINYDKYSITAKELEIIKEDSIILHPFPRRQEISVEVDNDTRAHYWKQARNGMWIRAALILKLFQRQHWI